MKPQLVFAVLVLNGINYWVPCERGAVWCPHFNPPTLEALVSSGTINVAYVPAPSSIVEGVNQ